MIRIISCAAALVVSLIVPLASAQAQATRTWVSGVGDDVNPCSRTAPCKTFAGAISKTAAGGEISVLDSGGFGAVTITKAISIVAQGAEGGILASLTTGVIVNAGPNDVVNLEGLYIEGAGTGVAGVRLLAGRQLNIRNCVIEGFRSGLARGIDVAPTGVTRLYVSDTAIRNNQFGIVATTSGAALAAVFLKNVDIVRNDNTGVIADGTNTTVRLYGSAITFNNIGLAKPNNGNLISFGNNAIEGNTSTTAPTVTSLD